MKIVLGLFLFLVAPLSHSQEAQCPSAGDVAEVSKTFQIQELDTNTKSWIRTSASACDSKSLAAKIISALVQIKNLPALAPLSGSWKSNIIGTSPYVFLSDRVKTIRIDTHPNSSQCKKNNENVLAYAGDAKAYLINICLLSDTSTVLTLMTSLLHEARHLLSAEEQKLPIHKDKKQFNSHVFCERGLLAHEFACDPSYDIGGSYAVGVEFLLKVSRTESVSFELRQKAHQEVVNYARTHFNKLPGETHTGALLVDSNHNLMFYDTESREITTMVKNLNPSTIVTMRLVPTFFDIDRNTVTSYEGPNVFSPTEGTFAAQFQFDFTPEEKKNLRDVYYGSNYACFLFAKQLRCESGITDSVTINFPPEITAAQFAAMNEPINGSDIVHVVSETGALYLLPLTQPITEWKISDLSETPSFKNFNGVGIMPKLVRVALTNKGEFVTYDDPKDLHVVPELKSHKFKKMMAPYYWTPSLSEL